MAFRKRNITVGRAAAQDDSVASTTPRGVRPSILTSHPVTSTGTPSLDDLLGGHAGLALGSTLLIEESGTTDFTGALLRYYAAEGLCQGHYLHVVGIGEDWVRNLPGLSESRSQSQENHHSSKEQEERMKIAWRYERLHQATERASPLRGNLGVVNAGLDADQDAGTFCHTFDLTKRLAVPPDARVTHIPISLRSPFENVIQSLTRSLSSSSHAIHRLVIPSLLNPAIYPPEASRPEVVLVFLRTLRSLLRQNPTRLTAMISLPLELYPRNSGLVRWMETLSDGALELTPFPHIVDNAGEKGAEDQPQGMLKVHKLPINTEKGEGGAGAGNSLGEDLAFTVSRRKFVIRPYSLPPVEGDQEAQEQRQERAKGIDF